MIGVIATETEIVIVIAICHASKQRDLIMKETGIEITIVSESESVIVIANVSVIETEIIEGKITGEVQLVKSGSATIDTREKEELIEKEIVIEIIVLRKIILLLQSPVYTTSLMIHLL